MAGQGTATKAASIDNAFAGNPSELYANHPFHGAVSRLRNGQQVLFDYVQKQDRLTLQKWLDQKDISQGQFMLETQNEAGQDVSFDFMVDKNADPAAANPFFQNMPAQPPQDSGISSMLKEQLEAEIRRLESNLKSADRKNRELTDDLLTAKRELAQDNTQKMLSHKDALSELKETYRDEKEALKEEISELKTELRFKELEYMQGDRDGWTRVLDFVQNNLSDDFFSNILSMLQQQGGGVQQASAQQLKDAYNQQMQNQFDNENPQPDQSTRDNPEQPQPQTAASKASQDSQSQHQPTQAQQMAQVKHQLSERLTNAALSVLTDQNANLKAYATEVQSQLALLRHQGVTLDAGQWMQMAKILGERAVQREITPERVAQVIEPALAGVPKTYRMMLGALDPQAATNQLFKSFNVEAPPPVQKMVVKVLGVIKNSN